MPENKNNKIIDLRKKQPGINRGGDLEFDESADFSDSQVIDLKVRRKNKRDFSPTPKIVNTKSPVPAELPKRNFVQPKPQSLPESQASEPKKTTRTPSVNFLDSKTTPKKKPVKSSKPARPVKPKQPRPSILEVIARWRQQRRQKPKFNWGANLVFKKSLALFILACFFSVSSVKVTAFFQGGVFDKKNQILSDAHVAYQYMDSGGHSILDKDYDLASYKFSVAAQRFVAAQDELNVLGTKTTELLAVFPGGAQVSAADNLLEAGSNFALTSQYTAQALEPFTQTPDLAESLKTGGQENESSMASLSFTDALLVANGNLVKALEKAKKAENHLNKVNVDVLPADIADQVQEIKSQVPKACYALEQFLSYSEIMLKILGHDNPRKYLFLFQNNREMRATGGFIGTYGLFDINEGNVENIKIEGPYNIDGQLLDKVTAPTPLRLITPRFYMRDANWFADYPTSARKVAEYYEKSGGATVDGTIAITANFTRDLLEVTGPIEMSEYGITINAENFFVETQHKVEFDYDKEENRPKKFLADLFPKLIDNLSNLDREKWPQVLGLFFKALEKKDIMFYFNDEELENLVTEFGWGGQLSSTEGDYLNVISSNIGGGKTDQVVSQDVELDVDIKDDGSVVNTLIIKRKHNGSPDKAWEDVKNVSYLRTYVPLGSKLISAEGYDSWFFNALINPLENSHEDSLIGEIEKSQEIHDDSEVRIFKEGDKTVFGNWIGVEPGEEKVVKLKYKLPFKLEINKDEPISNYSLVMQRQPGSENRSVSGQINYPDKWQAIWQHSTNGFISDDLKYQTELDTDKVIGVIFTGEELR